MSREREGAVCEKKIVMQILPGSSGNAGAYKCISRDLQLWSSAPCQFMQVLSPFCNAAGTLRRKPGPGFV
jgi:hypothetical protein